MKRLFTVALLLASLSAFAQHVDTLAIQDFEVIPQAPAWNFTGPVIYNSGYSSATAAPASSEIGIGGSRAWETTVNSTGLALDFDNISIPAGYDTVRFTFRLAAMSLISTNGGPDNLDYVLVKISTDGGTTIYDRLRIRGGLTDNSYWPYSATGVAEVDYLPQSETGFQPSGSGLQSTEGYSTCIIKFPGTVSQVKVSIVCRSSSSTDTWLIDNVLLTGENACPSGLGSTRSLSICQGDSTWLEGSFRKTPGTYYDTLTTAGGCDSVVTTKLNVNPTYTFPASIGICQGDSVWIGGAYRKTPGSFNDTLKTILGCDSIIVTTITVNPVYRTSQSISICAYESIPINSEKISSPGVYIDSLMSITGCDSLVEITLSVRSVNTAVSATGSGQLTAQASGASYQWLDCNNNYAVLSGDTNAVFNAPGNGNYAVAVTENGCTDTSACTAVVITGIDHRSFNAISLEPNPTSGLFNLLLEKEIMHGTVRVMNVSGQTVLEKSGISGKSVSLDISSEAAGIYFVEIKGSHSILRAKLVKN